MKFSDLKREADRAGVEVRNLGRGHWQVIGKYVVNFYPYAKGGPTMYLAGTAVGGDFDGDASALVQQALQPSGQRKAASRKKRYGQHKVRLLQSNPVCYWCGIAVSRKDAILDHKIPLDKGGSNGYDNLVLACASCDKKKGNKMPHDVFPNG